MLKLPAVKLLVLVGPLYYIILYQFSGTILLKRKSGIQAKMLPKKSPHIAGQGGQFIQKESFV